MAVNYANLFNDLGELYTAIEELEAMMVTVEATRTSILALYVTSTVTDLISDINQTFDQIIQQLESGTSRLVNSASLRLRDRDTVIEQLPNLTSTRIDSVIFELIAEMLRDSETVLKSVVTLTPGAVVTTNSNVGELVSTALLPGDIVPGRGFRRNRNLAGALSQYPLDDELSIVCTRDSQNGGVPGDETFIVTGLIPQQTIDFASNQGGNRGSLNLNVNNGNLITNFFETFTTPDIPDGWEIITGEVVTDFSMGSSAPLLGENDLVFVAGGNTVMRYNITGQLIPDQLMCIFVWLKRPGAGGSGFLDVRVNINGAYTVDQNTSPNSATYDSNEYVLWSYPFVVPSNLGDEQYVEIQCDNNVEVRLDGGGLCPMQQYAGIGLLIVQGGNNFLVDDSFALTIANNEAGKLQRLFTRGFGYQLPSATSGAETIADPA